MDDIALGWLAGLWDGEGSVGIIKADRATRPTILSPAVQLQITCERTAKYAAQLLAEDGIRLGSYLYREKRPEHKPSWHLRVSRFADTHKMAELLGPISVTKQNQWRLLREFTSRRLVGAVILPDGRLKRGGKYKRPYTDEEIEIYEQLRALNARGV